MIPIIKKDKIKSLRHRLIKFIKSKPKDYKNLFLNERKINKNKINRELLILLKELALVKISRNFIIPNVRINYIKNKILICTDLCSYKKEDQIFPIHAEQIFLIDNLKISKENHVLELGVGSGIISIFAALKAKKVYGAEINDRAIKFAKFNCALNNVGDKVKIVKSDWFSKFEGMKFDVIFSNPPFEPVPKGLKHFYHSAAGEDGLDIIRKFLSEFKNYLKPKGKFHIVTYSIANKELLLAKIIKKVKGRKEILVLPQFMQLLEFMEKYPLTKRQEESYKKKKLYLVVLNVYLNEHNKLIVKKLQKKDAKRYGNILFPLGMQERGVEVILDLELLKKIQKIQKNIKSKSPKNLLLKEISWSDIAPTRIKGRHSKRLMVVVVAKGCTWAKKGSGPCTMCNFWFVCSENASTKQIVELFKKEINKYNFKREGIEEIDIYNAGSFLNDAEMSKEARIKIMETISKIKPIRKVLIESRPEYINERKIKELKKILGKKELEIGIGLESSDNFVREILINKGFNLKLFEESVKIIKKSGASFFVYVLIKPVFLTEKEAIEDVIKSIKYSFNLGKKLKVKTKIALEPVFIKQNTLIYKLYKNKAYSHVWLWSVIEVLKQISKLGEIQVGISSEGMKWHEMPRNCKKCTPKVIDAIVEYNKNQNLNVFKSLDCECIEKWKKELKVKPTIPIEKRVEIIAAKI